MRDRGVWFVENLTERFMKPPHEDEYFPPATLPQDLLPEACETWEDALTIGAVPYKCDPNYLQFQGLYMFTQG